MKWIIKLGAGYYLAPTPEWENIFYWSELEDRAKRFATKTEALKFADKYMSCPVDVIELP